MKHTGLKRRFTSSFVLTLEEKKIICFVLLAFVFGMVTKEYRDNHPPPTPPTIKATMNTKRSAPQSKKIQNKEPGAERRSGQ
ncbi:MAG: hypothetical protein ABJB22_03520 [Verrucomicrobiota bacterium]